MRRIKYFVLIFLVNACQPDKIPTDLSEEYLQLISEKRAELLESRKKNYLSLVGLFKLNPGKQTFGSAEDNDFQLSIPEMPGVLGSFSMESDSIFFESDFEAGKQVLVLDEIGNSKLMDYDRWSWMVITRGGEPYLRIWDAENPQIQSFKGYASYPLHPEYIIEGSFTYYETQNLQQVFSKLGVNETFGFIGQVSFLYNEKEYSLDVGPNGFTMINDVTTGKETYEGGRYIYLDLPEKNGPVTLDLNLLYNPPCSFSKYTTCLVPPKQNTLPFGIYAGEKVEPISN